VIILILAAIITPPDVFSQVLVFIPLIILYEVSIWISARIKKKQDAEFGFDDDDDDDHTPPSGDGSGPAPAGGPVTDTEKKEEDEGGKDQGEKRSEAPYGAEMTGEGTGGTEEEEEDEEPPEKKGSAEE
jgi:hypothetical protein